MAQPVLQRKRSSAKFQEDERPVIIKRQFSERTLMANKLEHCHLTGRSSPRVTADQVPSLSPKLDRALSCDGSFFLDHLDSKMFQKGGEVTGKLPAPKIEQGIERDVEQRLTGTDDFCLSEKVENELVSFAQTTVVDDVGDLTTTTDEAEDDDEPDGLSRFIGKVAHAAHDVFDIFIPHRLHRHHDHDEQQSDRVHDHQCGQDEVDNDEGFAVHLPARICQFDTPCSLGARLRRTEKGYHIANVLGNSTAQRAGLRESDIITHLNETDLRPMGNDEIQKRFMDVEKIFTLTILRLYREGDEVHLKKITIRVTIGDEVVVEVLKDEVVWNRQPRYVTSSAMTYVYQDEDGAQQIYLNNTGSRVTMGTYSDERAQYYLDFFSVLRPMPSGQPCTIRNAYTSQIYDPMQNTMKTVKNYKSPDQLFMLDKIPRHNGTFVFESMGNRGHYLIYERSTGTLKLSQFMSIEYVPMEGSFYTADVKGSRSTWV